MENLRRHFAFSGQANKGPLGAERSSVFHVDVKHEVERVSSAAFSDCSEPSRPSTINSNRDMNPNGQESTPQALAVFLQCLSRYHGAGTNLREKLNALLKGTLYEPLAAMCNTNLPANLFERRPDLVQLATEAHTLLSGMQERPPKTESSQQTVLRCMLLLLKLEAQYHEICLREVHASLRKLAQSCTTHSCHDILQLLASLGLTNLEAPNGIHSDSSGQYKTGSDQAPPLPAGCHDNLSVKDSDRSSLLSSDEIASPKLPPKQNSSKSSIFSLFGRKNSPDDGKLNGSSFYVDIKSEKPNRSSSGEFSGQELLVDTGGVLSLSVTPPPPDDFVLHNDLPLIPEKHGAQNTQKGGNGQLVSEEEIDSVINLLSGCPSGPGSNSSSRTSPQMQSIPENKVTSSHLDRPREQLSVPMPTGPAHRSPSPVHRTPSPAPSPAPVITNIPITVTHENDSLKPPQRTQLHRRSEGSIDFASGTMGRNTWPHQHRPGGLPNAPPPHGFYDPLSQDHLFGRRFSSEFQTRPRGYYGGHLLSNTSWLFPESRLQHTWNTLSSHTSSQASGLATAGSDTMASSNWSGFQDSSDLSDDSSSGDQFFAVGLDLVNALDSKNDSSDDECDPGFFNGAKDQRPRSMENLLDVKSNHTWPPKQPWARSALVISEAMEQSAMDNLHRPLQMQWSDPMSSRNVWGAAGLGPQLSHRSMHDFGHLPH